MADAGGARITYVAVAIRDEQGRILLVRQAYGDELWSLPGHTSPRHA